MVESVRVQTRGAKHTTKQPSVSAFLKGKDATECRLILPVVPLNASDCRRPRRFRLPRLEGLGRWSVRSLWRRRRKRVYLAKINLTNCYRGVPGVVYLWWKRGGGGT